MLNKEKVCIICNGCPENRIDSARVYKYFKENGWVIVDKYQDADLILFNSCALTENLESVSLNIIKEIMNKKKKNSKMIVWGCLPLINPDILKNIYNGPTFSEKNIEFLDLIVSPDISIKHITANQLIKPFKITKKIGRGLLRYEGSFLMRFLKQIVVKWDNILKSKINICNGYLNSKFYYIKISTGCLSFCTYCGVKISRGNLKSIPIEDVLSEFDRGIKKGFKYFGLLGTDLGSYGRDLGFTLFDLLKKMINYEEDFKIGLRNVNPFYLKDNLNELSDIIKTRKIYYIELPVESGSNRILKIMNRKYNINDYKKIIKKIRDAYSNILIKTQIMVGFPTETEDDFKQTMNLLDEVVFDYVEVYPYSKRPGTLAANMDSQVPDQILKERYYKLFGKALLNRTLRKIKILFRNAT